MDKFIIDNRSDLPMSTIMDLIQRIIDKGRVSNNGKQYCYLTAFKVGASEYHIVTDLNAKSDRFVCYKVIKIPH